jgi:alkanesulfonate monooxygenase SsuD/methylene tetrahydromethanopterin reductase-like flavin-dependent oxidoreductase (luciferase family)
VAGAEAQRAKAVEIVKSMWTEADTSYDGRHFTLQGAQCDPSPCRTRTRPSSSAAPASS